MGPRAHGPIGPSGPTGPSGPLDPALLNFFSNFFSEIKREIPWEFLIWWGSDLEIQGLESQDFVFWAFDPPPNGKFPGNFPFGGGSIGPPPNGKFLVDPNPAVVLEAAVAADREWCVCGGGSPPQKVYTFFCLSELDLV